MKSVSIRVFSILLLTVAVIRAQQINLSGVVSNSDNQPVANAIVSLASLDLKDTTDAGGAYSLRSSTGALTSAPVRTSTQNISMVAGILSVPLNEPADLAVELFDMRGCRLLRITENHASAVEYRLNVSRIRHAAKTLLIRISINNNTSVLRYIQSAGDFSGHKAPVAASSAPATLAKALAAVDTLKVSATGYYGTAVPIESYESVKNISLEQIAAGEKFSFFVTSMSGLQELSGSENGFGGDLRFGKTGPGAGLLGADSICACLAEMSMPGSSAKKWSAFLSAEKGVDGNQVNAIDRIGEGPWYDRMGRLVANNTGELLNPRPINADSAIINDLPNEYGIPNHRPDPTQPIVDNHMTVTGSDSLGQLYISTGGSGGWGGRGEPNENGYTCLDWTTDTLQEGPRVGLSWPQSLGGMFGMKHWISSFDASGCEPGYDLDERTGAGERGVYTIGNGGGYGGFYCFAHQP